MKSEVIMVIVGCTFQVFYEKATAEAMAHRVAEAFRRGSARGFDLVVTCDLWSAALVHHRSPDLQNPGGSGGRCWTAKSPGGQAWREACNSMPSLEFIIIYIDKWN